SSRARIARPSANWRRRRSRTPRISLPIRYPKPSRWLEPRSTVERLLPAALALASEGASGPSSIRVRRRQSPKCGLRRHSSRIRAARQLRSCDTIGAVIRKAFRMKVNAGREAEYERRHRPIWRELEDVLIAHGVRSYSIYLDCSTNDLF